MRKSCDFSMPGLKIFYDGNLRGLVFWLNCNLQFIANFGISNVNSYKPAMPIALNSNHKTFKLIYLIYHNIKRA